MANLKRSRGRGRKPGNNVNRSYESNGPDVKIRGNAAHISEKYQQLARDAAASGDRVGAENYFQHAEHYYRLVLAAQQQQQEQREQREHQRPQAQDESADDASDDSDPDSQSGGDGAGAVQGRRRRRRRDTVGEASDAPSRQRQGEAEESGGEAGEALAEPA